jgi:1,4-dihydroxy-2-naphthoate octaprenyltransferase
VIIGVLGALSLLLAYGYTGGPFPLAYLGLGEVFVLLFFGFVATAGSYFIFAKELNLSIFIIGAQVGLLSCVLISINNFRDKETDRKVGKNTLATKLSTKSYLLLIDVFLFLPYLLLFLLVLFVDLKYFFPLFAIPLAHKIRNGIRNIEKPSDCNIWLVTGAKHLLLFGIFHCLASLWS